MQDKTDEAALSAVRQGIAQFVADSHADTTAEIGCYVHQAITDAGFEIVPSIESIMRQHGVTPPTEEAVERMRQHFIEQRSLMALGRAVQAVEVESMDYRLGRLAGETHSRIGDLMDAIYREAGMERRS